MDQKKNKKTPSKNKDFNFSVKLLYITIVVMSVMKILKFQWINKYES